MTSIDPVIERVAGIARKSVRRQGRFGRRVVSFVGGKTQAAREGTRGPKEGMDDVTLARKVESELFRPADAPKGTVDISVVDRVVELRGQVKRPGQIKALEAQVRSIPEVREVRNLLHLPGTPSPTRTDSPRPYSKRGQPSRSIES